MKRELNKFIKTFEIAKGGFDKHGNLEKLARFLKIETPDEYAKRKSDEDGSPDVFRVDDYSFARKMVAILGDGWLWSVVDEHSKGKAVVWHPDKPTVKYEAETEIPEFSLIVAALKAKVAM